MKKSKIIVLLGAVLLLSFSSCGIFRKGCGCPHFGAIKFTASKHPVVC